ncbi:hypothetical protein [Akkermansia muciniphila]|jgi:hypothetical protein|uniref:hypothetical protein n=1 Tax=Akkermansia muciniphila TaxID=239935 RepID=UPI000C9B9FAD|nr:hypothetical protein [Akkermansia muciniphila]PNC65420.1 hypothetical protein CXU00_07650 [Akkermansia muciniphila]PNC68080.1 hypothetical protein CXT99_05080 [Akkermansia muciniphila]QAT91443.1 hypothetical protein AKKM5201_05550 [Akkermansia muciniphila]
MNIGIPNHVKDLNPPLSNYDSIVKFDDIQKLNIIKVETFEYNDKKQTFYRMDFYPSCKDSNNNITLIKEQYEKLNTLLMDYPSNNIYYGGLQL